jgi:hypothetical protein
MRCIHRASKKDKKAAKNLEKIVDLSRRHNHEYHNEDLAQILEYIDQCLLATREHLMTEENIKSLKPGKNRMKFMRLAEKRANKVSKQLLLIGKLSNKTNYAYSSEEVAQMFAYIEECVTAARNRFQTDTSGPEKTFTLGRP